MRRVFIRLSGCDERMRPVLWGVHDIVFGVRVRCAVLGPLPLTILCGLWWWFVGFAVVIVVGKRPVNRSDPGS